MALLARREHSRRELARKLKSRGYTDEQVQHALASLTADGLQSDARFAEAFVRQRMAQGYGPRKIQYELQERGISADQIRGCLPDDAETWLHQARTIHRKRFGQRAETPKELAKQQRYLQARGFDFDIIKRILSN